MNDESATDSGSEMTDSGRARREAMLDELVGSMQRIHRARRHRRVTAACILVLATIGIATQAMLNRSTVAHQQEIAIDTLDQPEVTPPTESRELIQYSVVATDTDIVERLRATGSSTSRRIERVNDDGLLDTLSDAGYQVGLIEFGNQIRLSEPVPTRTRGLAPSESRDPAGSSDPALG